MEEIDLSKHAIFLVVSADNAELQIRAIKNIKHIAYGIKDLQYLKLLAIKAFY